MLFTEIKRKKYPSGPVIMYACEYRGFTIWRTHTKSYAGWTVVFQVASDGPLHTLLQPAFTSEEAVCAAIDTYLQPKALAA